MNKWWGAPFFFIAGAIQDYYMPWPQFTVAVIIESVGAAIWYNHD